MSESHKLSRLYGEKEIGRILKRATELQDASTTPSAAGMTLAELEEIAAEAGIDGQYLRRAARELDTGIGEPSLWTKFLGEELHLFREITLPGELPESGFERIVAVIQRISSLHCQPSLLGRTLTWRAESPNKARTVQVIVTSRDGETHVRIEDNLSQLAGGLFGGIVAGGGLGVGLGVGLPIGIELLGSALFSVAAPLGFVALTYVGTREIYRAVVRSRRRLSSKLLDGIVEEVEACMSEQAAQLAEGGDP